jgi:hypothetical protein
MRTIKVVKTVDKEVGLYKPNLNNPAKENYQCPGPKYSDCDGVGCKFCMFSSEYFHEVLDKVEPTTTIKVDKVRELKIPNIQGTNELSCSLCSLLGDDSSCDLGCDCMGIPCPECAFSQENVVDFLNSINAPQKPTKEQS